MNAEQIAKEIELLQEELADFDWRTEQYRNGILNQIQFFEEMLNKSERTN